ncbi:MAG: hypothetical protein B0W54_11810 [Cellvibrio sp. 79]|nr:MAG: hypothetical protein B0W54_11810 [Cellvibrio sp. 79]
MHKVIFTISIVVSVGLGYMLGKGSDSSNASLQPSESSIKKSIQESNSIKSPHIVAENKFNNDAQLTANQQKNSLPVPVINQATQSEIDAIKAEYEIKQRAESFAYSLTKSREASPWSDFGGGLRERFDAEGIDYEWANREENHIQSLFLQKDELSGIAIKSTTCKSTQCQITISVMDQNHANETAMAITKVLGAEKSVQIIIDNQAQQSESIFYIARDEKGFELN